MTTTFRWLKFNAVGAAGIVVQAAALELLLHLGSHYLAATVVAVEAAVVHNFVWHRAWTWRDRPGRAGPAFLRFNATNGLLSIAGNLAIMRLLVEAAGMRPLLANLISIAVCSLVNFVLADRLVFVRDEAAGAGAAVLT